MPIPFTQIPSALLVPGQYNEIDNSLAGSAGEIKRALIIAYKSSAGTAEAGTPVRVLAEAKAAALFGHGSPAACMASAFLEINKIEECWVLPVEAPKAATPWVKKFSIHAASVQQGAVAITINGTKLDAAAISAGSDAVAVAAAILARINSDLTSPVLAEALGGSEFAVKSVVPGSQGNDNTVVITSEAFGLTITEGSVTSGTQTANLKPLLKKLGSVRYNYIASDFNDADNISALAAELTDRYTALRQIGGRAFIALSGNIEAVLKQAQTVNNPHIVLVPRGENPQLPAEWSARWCAAASRILADDPAANTYDLAVPGLHSKLEIEFYTRQSLLMAGVATFRTDATGDVLIERLVTTYTENTDGGRDTSYLDVQVTETVDAIRTSINATAKKRYKTWKLASTKENFGSGAKVMTVGIFRSFLCELYQEIFIKQNRWCQDFDGYKNSLLIEVRKGSKTWLEYSHQPNLIGQFLIGSGLTQFK